MDSKAREINPRETITNKFGMLLKKGNEHGERRENEKWELKAENWMNCVTDKLIGFIIHSKYFPDSDWLKAHV